MALISVKNPDDAMDIVQDVMLTLVAKYAHKPQDQWAPLFYRMLKNRTTDFHRRRRVQNGVFSWFQSNPEAQTAQVAIDQAPGQAADRPADRFTQKLAADEIARAVGELPARQQQAFMFRAWQELDVRQTGMAMGCSQGSVKTHYSRAVHTLREKLQHLLEDSMDE